MNAQTSRYSNVNFQHRSSCLESQWQSLTSSDIISGLNGIGVDPFHFIYIYIYDDFMGSAGCLSGVVVNVLATGPKGCAFKPGQGDGFLRAIKIHSTPSFRWEVKLEVPYRKILRCVKDPLRYFRY
jgi:hypothetical protein